MFAAPRTSAEGTSLVLRELSRVFPAATVSWIYIDRNMVYCFNQIEEAQRPHPGFRAGQIVSLEQTLLKNLQEHSADWHSVDEHLSLIVPLKSPKGQDLGYISVTVRQQEAQELKNCDIPELINSFRCTDNQPKSNLEINSVSLQ
jgi:hypothetical protein